MGEDFSVCCVCGHGTSDYRLENYPCNSKEALHARERHFSQTIPCVNMIKNQGLFNALGKTQYNKQFNEQHKEQTRKYCEQHKDQLKKI